MKEQLELGPVPCNEPCEQLGPEYNSAKAIAECRAFIHQLQREFPVPKGVVGWFKITANPHDFGTYHEVAVVYDDNDPKSIDWAFGVEGDTPSEWDEEARKELGI